MGENIINIGDIIEDIVNIFNISNIYNFHFRQTHKYISSPTYARCKINIRIFNYRYSISALSIFDNIPLSDHSYETSTPRR